MKNCMCGRMWSFLLVVYLLLPVAIQGQILSGYFPAETLSSRISRITKSSGRNIAFDENKVKEIHVTELNVAGKSVEEALSGSLQSTRFTFRKKTDNSFVVYEKQEEPARSPQQPAKKGKGSLSGTVVDERGESIPGATLVIKGANIATITDMNGKFSFRNLTEGTRTITVSFISFETLEVNNVEIESGKTTALDVAMKSVTKGLGEVVVTADYGKASVSGLYARQKSSVSATNGITAEQISRTPDNNAAQVLSRISGLQVSDDKNVVVRGLSDRYNNVQLNGVLLPSTDPNRRDFAFDIIPSAILDNITVNKTASPDMTGEFAGGLVQVNTKDIPDNNFIQLTVGTGYDTRSTGKEMLGMDRGKNAWLGFTSDIHKKPAGMSLNEYSKLTMGIEKGQLIPSGDPLREQIASYMQGLPDIWKIKKFTAMPTQNYQLQAGRVINLDNGRRFGIIAALTYRNDQKIEDREMHEVFQYSWDGTSYSYATTLGGVVNLGYNIGNHKFSFQNTYNSKFSNKFWKYRGVDINDNEAKKDGFTDITINTRLFQSQLGGEHLFGKTKIKADWKASLGRMDRDQPYSKMFAAYNGSKMDDSDSYPEDYLNWGPANDPSQYKNNNVFYSNLTENVYNWAGNFQIPFSLLGLEHSVKLGYQGKYREADFTTNFFRIYSFDGPFGYGVTYSQAYNKENFQDNLYFFPISSSGRIFKDTETAEGYSGNQRLHAYYSMLDFRPFKLLRLTGGVRLENNRQKLHDAVWEEGKGFVDNLVEKNEDDWLPSINAIYSITSSLNLRASYYKTVARPDFREISTFSYWDYDLFEFIRGNPLERTKIKNTDIRLEWYPSTQEIVSLGVFVKDFKNPIELFFQPTSGGTDLFYKNLEGAKDKGIEFDFRKSLGFIAPGSFLKDIFLSGNFTWIDASIEFRESDAVDETGKPVSPKRDRPLAGQSPYIINGGLLYAGKRLGINLAYNTTGRKVVSASTSRADDRYERPRDILDFQLSYKLFKNKQAEVKLNIRDLLNQDQIIYKNSYDYDNPNGLAPDYPSIQPFPGTEYEENFPAEYNDPKGASYNKDYDTVIKRIKSGTSFSLSFSYRF